MSITLATVYIYVQSHDHNDIAGFFVSSVNVNTNDFDSFTNNSMFFPCAKGTEEIKANVMRNILCAGGANTVIEEF